MSVETTTKYYCDICQTIGKSKTGGIPDGWVLIVVENKYVDRDFTDKHVCDKCANEIRKTKYEATK